MTDKLFNLIKKIYKIPPWLTFLVTFVIFFVDSFFHLDPDFGWHLKSGEHILRFGIPGSDIFTFTASDFPWIGHEWLADVLLYLLYSLGGYALVAGVFAGLWTLSFRLAAGQAPGIFIIIAALSTTLLSGVRMVTFTVLAVSILILILRNKNQNNWKFIPTLFLVWVNLHGSFVLGLAIMIYYTARYRSRNLFLLSIVSTTVTILNPYGWYIYEEIFRTITDTSLRSNISEWGFLPLNPLTGTYIVVWLSGFIYFYGRRVWKGLLDPGIILLIAGILSARMYPVFVIVSLFDIKKFSDRILSDFPKNLSLNPKRFLVFAGTLLILAVTYYIYTGLVKGIHIDREVGRYPKNIANHLSSSPCKGNMFNNYNFGGYLIWRAPNQKVYIDGRMPSWSKDGTKYMEVYMNVLKKSEDRREEFIKYNIRCAVLTKNRKIDEKLRNDLFAEGWVVRAEDKQALLLEQREYHGQR